MSSLSVNDFVSRYTSFIFILTVFNSLNQYSQLTQKVLNDLCLTNLQLILENTEFFFGDVPFTSHIVPQRACRKAAVVRDWSTDILDWESPTSEQVQTQSGQRDQDSKSAYLQFANSYRLMTAEGEFEFLIMADWAEATKGEIFVINRIVLCNSYESLNVWHN